MPDPIQLSIVTISDETTRKTYELVDETARTGLSKKSDKITEVTVSSDGTVTQALDPGKIYHFTGTLTALTITLNAAATGQIAHYHFDFDSGSTAPTLSLPATVTMPSGFSVNASHHYEIDILDTYGIGQEW